MHIGYLVPASLYLIRAASATNPQVVLGNTTIVGLNIPSLSQDFFGGIPYAEAPIGSLRLAPPIPKYFDSDVFNATSFGPACLQNDLTAAEMSEDCLSINVFRPSNISVATSLPVLFWTHGSGFETKSSSLYNASQIVAQSIARGTPIIFVSINYRLGALGWPQGAEVDSKGILNLGLMDQVTGLQWVQENIEAFGGDKTKVTIGGESAGALMSSTLFMHSSVLDYGRAGIFESGFPGSSPIFNATVRQSSWDSFVSGVPSCKNITADKAVDCLRAANTTEVLQGIIDSEQTSMGFGPTLDGPDGFFPALPSEILVNGSKVTLPFISGQNKDEGTYFIDITLNYTQALVEELLQEEFQSPDLTSAVLDDILELYPDIPALGCPFGTGNDTFGLSPAYKEAAAIATDIDITSQRRWWTQLAANVSVPTYSYYFIQETSSTPAQYGVTHGDQIAYTFGILPTVNESSPAAIYLSEIMIEYFISFVNSLNPNDGFGMTRPNWNQYMPSNQVLLQLNGTNITTIPDDFRVEQNEFLVSHMSSFQQ